ncbi:uncharacterized protein LOC118186937 [Stegodyphus dumicola]|uniref:uncharacterized protein LOC118186937 n=1 Tax=Stegodyphus dumicola TaxID=202533 RepID=UPI0015A985ED|nr:uncharacterized protein LOC118186937 [Stegodyphus dumicola]
MVESCLTEDVLKAWQRSSLFNQPEGTDLSRLTNLMKFLKSEVEGEERLKLARNGLDGVSRKEGYHDKAKRETKNKFKFKKQGIVPTATGFLTTREHAWGEFSRDWRLHQWSFDRTRSEWLKKSKNENHRDDSYAFRYPILLPSKHCIVDCLIRDYHLKHSHAGVQALTVIIREEFWIIGARRRIRSVVKQCVRCKRFSAKPPTTAPIQLPLDRVRDAFAFEVTGIDLCGPLILKNKNKTWVVLFTCAVYRCVHLELVTSVSTECFIQAFRRFIARRGRPSTVYSDNGTNFVGTSALLKKVDWVKVIAQETLHPITWKFIPPTAAWWGGWWERLIRTAKNLIVRVLGQAAVNYEELLPAICDVEAVINCRPLTYVSNDSEDLLPLTPSMFLQDIKVSGTADLGALDRNKLLAR